MSRLIRLARTAGAVAAGLGPGLALPFVLALRLAPADSDRAVLTFSVATSLLGIVLPAIESQSIAIAGRSLRPDGTMQPGAYARMVRTSTAWAGALTVLGSLALGFAYSVGRADSSLLWPSIAVIAATPLLGAVAAVNSGALIARSRTTLTISTQGLRATFPLIALVCVPGIAVMVLAALFVAGEGSRALVLFIARRREFGTGTDLLAESEPRLSDKKGDGGLPWQMGANALGEINPVVGRALLAPFASGSVTSFELSDKVVGLLTQVAYNFVFLPRVGAWSTETIRRRRELFVRDSWAIFLVSAVTSVLGVVAIQVASWLSLVPQALNLGLSWACIALAGAPAVAVVSGAVRYIAILNGQRLMTVAVAAVVAINVATASLLVFAIGPVGVVISIVTTRYLLMFGMLAIVRRLDRR